MAITGAGLRLAAARSTTIRTTPARCTAPSSAAAGFAASRSAVARSTTTATRYTAPSFTVAGFAASRSTSSSAAGFAASRSADARFAPTAAGGARVVASRLLPLRCATDEPPAPLAEALPPKESPSKWKLVASKLWTVLIKDGLHWGFLIGSLFVGYLATKEHPNAAFLITICEKGEKLYKFVSHFVPILLAIIKCFW